MKKKYPRKVNQFLASMENLKLMADADVLNDPYYQLRFAMGNSPLREGKRAVKANAQTGNILIGKAIANQFRPSRQDFPKVNPDDAIFFGHEIETGRPVLIPKNLLTRHCLIHGDTGSGKSNLQRFITTQLVKKNINVVMFDFKDEGRRFLNIIS